jgi:uncharacterized protein YtpQ (UPF0354 family)
MPRPVPWEWAKPRLLPLLCGPVIDPPGERVIRTVCGPGCAIEIGMDLGGVFPVVDAPVAERWETSPDQLRDAALANLRRRTARLSQATLNTGAFSGRIVRMLRGPAGYAASLVLLQDELMRVFGSQDQVFAAPGRSLLVSFPIDAPLDVVVDTVIDLELSERLPLMLDPFVLTGGRLLWQPAADEVDEELDT